MVATHAIYYNREKSLLGETYLQKQKKNNITMQSRYRLSPFFFFYAKYFPGLSDSNTILIMIL